MTPAAAGSRKWGLRRYLVAGILIWLPILATLWVVTFFIHIMDETLLLLPLRYRPEALVGFALPGLGAVFAFLVVLATGLLVTNLIGRQLVAFSEELLNRIPVVRSVYGGVKSFAESVFSQSNSFRKVVMIEYPRAGVWSLGFMTAEDVPEISRKTGAQHCCVYISNALNATAGFLVIVPRSQVVELDMSVDAAMKMIITCGVVVPNETMAKTEAVTSAV
ncbi:MAG: rane protein [Gammaproteobacteria bacterium]|nr:rane protein [Gammaproteobacteria bacterium]